MTELNDKRRGRLQLLLLAAIFLGPLAVAAIVYYGARDLAPDGRTNNGTLVEPVIALPEVELEGAAALLAPDILRGRWSLIYLARADCAAACRDALITIRQIRLGAGKESDRIQRVLLSDAALPDADWLDAEQAGLIIARPGSAPAFATAIAPLAEGIYIVDPLGNLMMAYPIDAEPKPVYADLKKLLKYSRIG